jgi:beta-fructofuranosidase
VHQGKPPETAAEQWLALGDKNLITWQKYAHNPVLSEELQSTKIFDWRDPYVFQDKGRTFMVLGGNLNQRAGGKAVVALYQAENEQLTKWRYRGVMFTHPDPKVVNIECPNFFRLGNKWVLLVSPHGPVEYFVGDFDAASGRFTVESGARLDQGDDFYAPNGLTDPRGRHLIWGWIKGFKNTSGWNGCLTLPRVLALDTDGTLLQKPAPEIRKLRTDHFRLTDVSVENSVYDLAGVRGECLELYVELELLGADYFELQVRRSDDGNRSTGIRFNGTELAIGDAKIPFHLQPKEKTLKLDIFLDRSLLELFANDRACYTGVLSSGKLDAGVALAASDGAVRVRSFHAWKMKPIW